MYNYRTFGTHRLLGEREILHESLSVSNPHLARNEFRQERIPRSHERVAFENVFKHALEQRRSPVLESPKSLV